MICHSMWQSEERGITMSDNRFLSELFVLINYDENFSKTSLIMDEDNMQLMIQVKDGSKFRIKVENADNVKI